MPRFICFTYNGVSQICYITGDCKNASFPLFSTSFDLAECPLLFIYWPGLDGTVRRPIQCGPASLPPFASVSPTWSILIVSEETGWLGREREGSKWIQVIPLSVPLIRRVISFLFYWFYDDQLVTSAVWLSTFCVFNSDSFSFFSIFSLSHHCFFLFSVSLTFGSEWGVCVCVCVRPRRRLKIYLSLSV